MWLVRKHLTLITNYSLLIIHELLDFKDTGCSFSLIEWLKIFETGEKWMISNKGMCMVVIIHM